MRFTFLTSLLLGLMSSSVVFAADYFPIDGVTVDTIDSDLWPVSNLIQGPGDGFSPDEPHDKNLGGSTGNWVTADDAGFPSDYPEDVGEPVIQFDLGSERTLKEISVWGYASSNANGTSRFSLRFATDAEGGPDGIDGPISYGDSITYNPTFDLTNNDTVQQYKLFDEHVTARYVEFTNIDNFFISPGQGTEPDVEPEPRLLPFVPVGDRVGLGEVAFMSLPESFQVGDKIPLAISADDFGTFPVPTTLSGIEYTTVGDPETGLLQEWFTGNGTSKGALDTLFLSNTPVTPAFRAPEGTSTWWTGNGGAFVGELLDYPDAVLDAEVIEGTDTDLNTYSVRLTGEILLEESGVYRFADGVDDYTYLAIDTDRSGVAGDSEGEVLIDDNVWTNVLRNANSGGDGLGEIEVEVGADGEWLPIEFTMSEGGGGDSGVLYWDYSVDDGIAGNADFFPEVSTDPIFDEVDAESLLVPDTHLRSSLRELVKADAAGALADAVQADAIELNVQVGPNGNDQIALANEPQGTGVSTLDVSGTTVRILADGEIEEGTEFQIFGADQVIGLDSLSLLFDDASLWDTSKLSEGILTFGPSTVGCDPNSMGDLDGNGFVEFADFLTLSSNFGTEVASHTAGDIDCDGTVGFSDFLTLSSNFGNAVGGAESVPEPSGLAMFGFAAMLLGFVRRRRIHRS